VLKFKLAVTEKFVLALSVKDLWSVAPDVIEASLTVLMSTAFPSILRSSSLNLKK